MRNTQERRTSDLGAGFRRLWAEKEITEGRMISAAQLAREASRDGGPVQASAPWSIILGRDTYSDLEVARLVAYFGLEDLGQVEEIGRMEILGNA